MAAEESVWRTFFVTLTLAVVCSFLVSVSAVGLRDRQEKNRLLDKRKNILQVAGLYDPAVPVEEAFKTVETKIVDLETGEYVPAEKVDLQASAAVPREKDVASIVRREKYAAVYLVRKNGKLDQVVLPVRGRGLWSMMYAFVALDRDGTTVRGITYYQHGETPGLGGEVENPRWTAVWRGKRVYGDQGEVRLQVVKGEAPDSAVHRIDGLSGATLTCDGVTATVQYWFSEQGYKRYLDKLRKGGAGG